MLKVRNMEFGAIATALLVLTGCTPAVQTTHMDVDDTRYELAVERYPVSIGVYFPDDFFENNFYNETRDGYHHTFHNNPADATRRVLDLALATTFAEVRHLDTLQEGLDAEDLAFVVVPNIVAMVADLAPEVIAVMVVYQFEFFADGEYLYSWQVSGIDSVNRGTVQGRSMSSGPIKKDVRPRAISPEQFDAVARKAVWDAISVLLTKLDQQRLLSDRLPASVVDGKAVDSTRRTAARQTSLALVGPVFDTSQATEKQRFEA